VSAPDIKKGKFCVITDRPVNTGSGVWQMSIAKMKGKRAGYSTFAGVSVDARDVLGPGRTIPTNHFDAVGTTIADRPPHRTVRARLRIRLPPWMGGEKAFVGIRMQNAGCWNPMLKDRSQPIPQCVASLTAAAKDQPPQAPKPLGEDV
jgi:hypothetical protein